jgi:hypothetical protein
MQEEDWLEYAQQQLLTGQELIDAARHKQPPDPTIVPIQSRVASTDNTATTGDQQQQSAADGSKDGSKSGNKMIDVDGNEVAVEVIGPTIKKEDDGDKAATAAAPMK